MNIIKSERFRLSKDTFGVERKDGKPESIVTIPRDSVIEIVNGREPQRKMIEVDWHGVRVMLSTKNVASWLAVSMPGLKP